MKRYLLFASDVYEPSGGWRDFIGDYDNLDAAKEEGELQLHRRGDRFFQVVDIETGEIILEVRK